MGLVAGVVVLVGLVVFLVVRPGPDDPTPAMPKPSATVSMPGDDSAIGDGVFDKPTVSATVGLGQRQFHVELPAAHAEGHLPGVLRPHAVRCREPGPRQIVSVATRSYTVKAAKGTKVCATVVVARRGQTSPGSDVQCETAQ